jgi:catechol 2,3-dioxygenase-like lactoylglutathione lyase family enzyme
MDANDGGASGTFGIRGLHHFAWRCRDAEETRHFYEDLLGLPLVHVIKNDRVPSTGEENPHVHIFFEMGDGSFMAFFDLGDDEAAAPSPNTPAWVNHIALEVPDMERLIAAKARLEAAGFSVVGVTDHHIIKSIYCFDPNGLRVELTTKAAEDEELARAARHAHEALRDWTAVKAARRAAAAG